MCAKSLQLCPALCNTLKTVAHQAPLSMGFSRQEYWSGLPCSPPGDLPNLGIEPSSLTSPTTAAEFFTTSATWEAHSQKYNIQNKTLATLCYQLWLLVNTWLFTVTFLWSQKLYTDFWFCWVSAFLTPVFKDQVYMNAMFSNKDKEIITAI